MADAGQPVTDRGDNSHTGEGTFIVRTTAAGRSRAERIA